MSAATGKVYAQYAVMCTVDGVTRLRTVSLISDYTTFADIPKIVGISLGRDPADIVVESATLIKDTCEAHLLSDDKELCNRAATTTVDYPVIGPVRACERHAN